MAPVVKNLPANTGERVSIPGLGRSPGEGNGNPLQYSCLGKPIDRGAWWAIVRGVAKSQTGLRTYSLRLSWKVTILHVCAQLCPTFYDPVACCLPGSSVHGIFQARILQWVTISFSRRSCQPRDRTQVSRIAEILYPLSHQGSPYMYMCV